MNKVDGEVVSWRMGRGREESQHVVWNAKAVLARTCEVGTNCCLLAFRGAAGSIVTCSRALKTTTMVRTTVRFRAQFAQLCGQLTSVVLAGRAGDEFRR